jgi:hypothetical protein
MNDVWIASFGHSWPLSVANLRCKGDTFSKMLKQKKLLAGMNNITKYIKSIKINLKCYSELTREGRRYISIVFCSWQLNSVDSCSWWPYLDIYDSASDIWVDSFAMFCLAVMDRGATTAYQTVPYSLSNIHASRYLQSVDNDVWHRRLLQFWTLLVFR